MSQSTTRTACSMTVVEPADVPVDARVVHFDELDDAAQDRVVARAASGTDVGPLPDGLEAGDVVVFTDYFRVVAH
ncbi:hypothetical protein ACFO0N_05935 [Halobium salinum]|uniref:DUF7979 domain-containing protein n=1 Tax=Halobium salinum TaxID=1364940 RepID=A0ABD5P9X0_9EURY|nr:hypothetical protein [Halobium salinum]